jgi:hypothetical protein
MPTITFDTLKFVESLKKSGFDEQQAKGLTSAFQEAQDTHLDELSTKKDLNELRLEIKGELLVIKWMLSLIIIVSVVPILRSWLEG